MTAFRYPDYKKGNVGRIIPLDCVAKEPEQQLARTMPLSTLGATAKIWIFDSVGTAVVDGADALISATAHRFTYAITAGDDAALSIGECEVEWADYVNGVERRFGPYPIRVIASRIPAYAAPIGGGGGPGENAAWVAIY